MKFKISFKDPDAVGDGLHTAAYESIKRKNPNLTDRQINILVEDEKTELEEFVKKWIEFGEYITIEFDTKTKKAKVLELNEEYGALCPVQ